MLLRKLLCIPVIFLILGTFSACTDTKNDIVQAPKAENEFEISVLKVGKADAIILKTKNHTAIIDCGEKDDGEEVLEYLSLLGSDKIDYLFVTHFDKDHVGGAAEVIKNFETDNVVVPDYLGTSKEYEKFEAAMEEKGITPTRLESKMTFIMDDVLAEVYPPERKMYSEGDNDYSLVISITHGENKFLFAGDAEEERLSELYGQLDFDHDFLKMPHHGRFNECTEKFLNFVSPEYTVICDSGKNPAEQETVEALEAVGSRVYYTRNGNVKILSDGTGILVFQ